MDSLHHAVADIWFEVAIKRGNGAKGDMLQALDNRKIVLAAKDMAEQTTEYWRPQWR